MSVHVGSSVVTHIPSGRDVDNREGYAVVGAEIIWEHSVANSQFCCKPKTALKHSLKKVNKIILIEALDSDHKINICIGEKVDLQLFTWKTIQ